MYFYLSFKLLTRTLPLAPFWRMFDIPSEIPALSLILTLDMFQYQYLEENLLIRCEENSGF